MEVVTTITRLQRVNNLTTTILTMVHSRGNISSIFSCKFEADASGKYYRKILKKYFLVTLCNLHHIIFSHPLGNPIKFVGSRDCSWKCPLFQIWYWYRLYLFPSNKRLFTRWCVFWSFSVIRGIVLETVLSRGKLNEGAYPNSLRGCRWGPIDRDSLKLVTTLKRLSNVTHTTQGWKKLSSTPC